MLSSRQTHLQAIALAGLTLMLAAPSLLLVFEDQRDLSTNDLTIVLASTALCILTLLGLHRLWPRFALVAMGVFGLFVPLQLWFIHNYGWVVDANALSLVAETNPAEAADLLGSVRPIHAIAVALPLFLAWLSWPTKRAVEARPFGHRTLVISGVMGLAGIYATSCWLGALGDPIVPDDTFPAAPRGQALALRGAYPAGLPLVALDYLRDRGALDDALARNKEFRFGVTPLPASPYRRVYVLVIGETTRADHLGINGYARKTTPALAERSGLVSFRRMYTVSTFTRLSVPVLISRKPPDSINALFNEASIVTAFKEAGFNTLWVSLQAPVGYHESPVSVHAYEADKTIFLNPADYRSHGKHDDSAIPILRQVLHDHNGRDTFIVIHTLGSHFRYSDRYPEKFRRFLPDRRPDRPLRLFAPEDREFLVNSYDNTVAFLDHVLDGIIQTLDDHKEIESWMLYSSDHGEALFDDCRMYSGHGQSALATHSVASLFWASQRYRETHPSEVSAMGRHRQSLASTAMLFETMASLAGMSVPGQRGNNSLAATPLRHPVEVAEFESEGRRACPSPTIDGMN